MNTLQQIIDKGEIIDRIFIGHMIADMLTSNPSVSRRVFYAIQDLNHCKAFDYIYPEYNAVTIYYTNMTKKGILMSILRTK